MLSLVALDLKPSQNFFDLLNKTWDEGDAVLPIDQRLPQAAKRRLVNNLGASSIITNEGEKIQLEKGFQVAKGDALVMATSGTTGEPKGVVHTHASIRASVTAGGTRLGCCADDHWLACLPMAHVGGLSVLLRAQHYGSNLSFIDEVNQSLIDNAIKKGSNLTSLVPTALRKLNVSGFRAVLVGGSAIPKDLPINSVSTYGLTETMGGVTYDGVALDGVEIRLTDTDEIEVRGEMLFRGYRDGSNPKGEDDWFATGDLGQIINGVLTIHGRKDDLINTGGYKVWPKSVENSISQMAGVIDCVVMGLPDDQWGAAVCAWIMIDSSHKAPSLDDVRKHVKKSLPDYCAPKKLFSVDEIPRSALGKVRATELLKYKNKHHE